MQKANLAALPCSLARGLQIVGEWWTLLVLRDICFGVHRFEEIHDHLGIARNILAARLDTLSEHGMLERRRYQTHPDRYEYHPTEMARDLVPAILALVAWGDRWLSPDGPPMLFTHDSCGQDTVATVVCSHCGEPLSDGELALHPGPGADGSVPPTRRVGGTG